MVYAAQSAGASFEFIAGLQSMLAAEHGAVMGGKELPGRKRLPGSFISNLENAIPIRRA